MKIALFFCLPYCIFGKKVLPLQCNRLAKARGQIYHLIAVKKIEKSCLKIWRIKKDFVNLHHQTITKTITIMKIDFHKSHKELLSLMKKMNINIITADEYKAFVKREGKDDALAFEDVLFENGATPILIERNGNSITVYDSNGKYRYFKSIARDIVKKLYELIAVYKPIEEYLTKFEYNVTFSNGFPIKVSVEAIDKDDANEKLYIKLSSISEEKPSVVEFIR